MEHEAMEMTSHAAGYLVWIPLLPLLGFLFCGLGWIFFREYLVRPLVNVVACLTVAGSFVISLYAFFVLRGLPEGHYLAQDVFTWISAGGLSAPFGIVFDRLSAVMCLVVTGVGGLIHVYSTGYMGHDPAYARYFAYLNLFTFAMLVLVSASNILLMFVGWEGVGLCSYLLIGFWYQDNEKSSAGKKAFIVNRIGDFGFLVGIFTIFFFMGTLDFYDMQSFVMENTELLKTGTIVGVSIATFIAIALFIGATGKSAQIPLYVWLPDAMAGPTPVSALIHAATMVTAGVYMIGRLNFIYVLSPEAMMLVAGIGIVTALFSATIGFTQTDIKKVLAYSTVSQLGYMFAAMGVGAFAAGIFHLTTHAFFKALLFLGAGSVIHGLANEQNMWKMGGLRKLMPITFVCMAAAWLSISGVFPFAGFVSKDEILWKSFANAYGHPEWFAQAVYVIGILAAVCTAIYMTRLMMLTFLTPSRMDPEVEHHAHEAPLSMTGVCIILAILAVVAGVLNWPHMLGGHSMFHEWLSPMWSSRGAEGHAGAHALNLERAMAAGSVVLAVGAIIVVAVLYRRYMSMVPRLVDEIRPLYQASYRKYWVDEIYTATVIEPVKLFSYYVLFRLVDVVMVDGIANGLGRLTKGLGSAGRRLQTGQVQTYAFYIVLGLLALLAFYFGFVDYFEIK
ncbi:MAG: NADH-quinone oxidoreductase subunit L [bacterium]